MRIPAALHFRHEAVDAQRASHVERGVGALGVEHRDVIQQRAFEHIGALRQIGDALVQDVRVELAQVLAVESNLACGGVDHAAQQMQQRGTAAAVVAVDGQAFAGFDLKRNIVEQLMVDAGELVADMVELQAGAMGGLRLRGGGGRPCGQFRVGHDLGQVLPHYGLLLMPCPDRAESLDRGQRPESQHHAGGQLAGGQLAVDDQIRAKRGGQRGDQGREQGADAGGDIQGMGQAGHGAGPGLLKSLIAPEHHGLHAHRLQGVDVVQGFDQEIAAPQVRFLPADNAFAMAEAKAPDDDGEKRVTRQQEQADPRVDHGRDADVERDKRQIDDLLEGLARVIRLERLDRLVLVLVRPGAQAFELVQRHGKHAGSHPQHGAMFELRRVPGAQVRAQDTQQRFEADGQRRTDHDQRQGFQRALGQDAVEDLQHDQRRGQGEEVDGHAG